MSNNAYDAPMHRNNVPHSRYAKRLTVVLLLINPFLMSPQGQATWIVVMCLARLSMAPVSYKYAVPARL
jgi:hypothetical protein